MCLSVTAFSQQSASESHPTPQAVLANPTLKAQADKIHEKELQLEQAATSSRARYAQVKEELTSLNKEYKVLLNKELALTAKDEARRELEAELQYVEHQIPAVTNQR
jgi:hypothetical protein